MKKIIIAGLIFAIAIYAFAQPTINSVSDSPDPVEMPGYNNITADITNATDAWVEISYPNATLMGNFSMTNIASTTTWYYNHSYSYPDPLGTYSYVVKAHNATGWVTSATYNFVLQDTTDPVSSVDTISPYWYNAASTITATATDNYAVANVSLWYRYSNDNATWGSWTFFGKDTASPWQWSFTFPSGEGYYEFYSIANDTAGNTEAAPGTADEIAAYDSTAPSSSVDSMTYWHTSLPVSITATASDSLSGVKEVSLYYRYSSDNSTWSSWQLFSTDSSSPWQWSFSSLSGDGYYEFYTIAEDNAGNTETAPLIPDENMGVDTTAPSTSISASPISGVYISPSSTITLSATDATSGVASTYYRIWNGSWHPSPGTGVGKSNNFYVYSGSFHLTKSGTNYVEYYSDDVAGNEESTHNRSYVVDNTGPLISNVAATPPTQIPGASVNITCTVGDTGAGVSGVYLEVTYPDSSFANFTMNHIPCTTYYREEIYNTPGTYDFTIYAVDNLGNAVKTGVYHFTITSANNPPATPSTPSGTTSGYTGISYTYTTATTDPDGDSVYYFFDWGDGSNSGWIGPYTSGYSASASHIWSSSGTYHVRVKAKDVNNAESGWSPYLSVTISSANNPPATPSTPSGTTSGYTGISYTYTTATTDPDGDSVYYFFDWGDGSNSGWIGPYTSGYSASASHIWSSSGTYHVRVKAKDVNNAESGWSPYLSVTINPSNAPPVTSYSLNPSVPTGKNGWYLTNVTVTLFATDPEGDAILFTKYRIDGGGWITYTAPFTITEDGAHLLEFYSQDDKGSTEEVKSASINIDRSKPHITIQRPMTGYLYLFDRQIWPLASGNTIIIGRILVRTVAYDAHSDIENVTFYVNGMVESIDTMYPYEWLWRGAVGYYYLSAVAYNKAGLKEETDPILVYIFSL